MTAGTPARRRAPTRLRVAGHDVGALGLDEVFEQVAGLDPPDGAALRRELIRRFERTHYVAPAAREDHAAALEHAFRAWRGERPAAVDEPGGALAVTVLGPGCRACERLVEEVREILAEEGIAASVEHVRDREALLEHGLVAYPALVVDGTVRAAGRTPTRGRLREILRAARGGEPNARHR